jgi:hypothetical protein
MITDEKAKWTLGMMILDHKRKMNLKSMIVDDKNTIIWKQWEWTTKVGWMGNNDNGWQKQSELDLRSGQYHVTISSFAYCFIM